MSNIACGSDQTAQCSDDELDNLLDDALKDFEKVPKGIKVPVKDECADSHVKSNLSNNVGGKGLPSNTSNNENPKEDLDNLFELTNNLTDALEKMMREEPSLKAQFDSFQQTFENSSAAFAENGPDLFDMDENIAKTFEELTKNFQDGGGSHDFESMLNDIQNEMGTNAGSAPNEEGFMGMMKGMMQNLLSKDLLYPSLKEIKEKYPSWLKENKEKISTEEYNKYVEQEKIVCKLCQLFEEEDSNASDSAKSEHMSKIVSYMEKMQEYGHPPSGMMENIVCNQHGGDNPASKAECNIM